MSVFFIPNKKFIGKTLTIYCETMDSATKSQLADRCNKIYQNINKLFDKTLVLLNNSKSINEKA
jgi:hypothetical protein